MTEIPDHVAVHRYGYNMNDACSAIVAAAIAAGTTWMLTDRPTVNDSNHVAFTVVAALTAALWVLHVSGRRKRRSEVTAALTGRQLDVQSNGALGHSWVDLNRVDGVTVAEFGSSVSFVLWSADRYDIRDRTRNPGCARVPVRLLTDPVLYGIVKEAIADNDSGRVATETLSAVPVPV